MGGPGGYSQNWWLASPDAEEPRTSCNDTDDLLSPEDVVMTAQNRADIEHYQTMANSVLKDVASHVSAAKGGY